ncbi:hypothetical protein NKH36_00055 [Mesorhizobium sp. M1312]|uniref:DUF6946 family protein n=1 Tax=unclassified Mesorhizobium TaxID=325217 RepID=UPI00333573EE
MTKIYFPSQGADDWRRLLADPVKHWRSGYSAMCLAECWENAGGLPPEIARLLTAIGSAPELLVALPEHKVPLPGARRGDSQNDLFALIRAGGQTVALTIEGKVDEPFDQPLGMWLANASDGKRERLAFVCDLLGLTQPLPDNIRYQLLHRTASAVIEARRFKTDAAAMIVHSFSPTRRWFEDYAAFVTLFGAIAGPDQLVRLHPEGTPRLYVGWASGEIHHHPQNGSLPAF